VPAHANTEYSARVIAALRLAIASPRRGRSPRVAGIAAAGVVRDDAVIYADQAAAPGLAN
jgi:hypothetical protein